MEAKHHPIEIRNIIFQSSMTLGSIWVFQGVIFGNIHHQGAGSHHVLFDRLVHGGQEKKPKKTRSPDAINLKDECHFFLGGCLSVNEMGFQGLEWWSDMYQSF